MNYAESTAFKGHGKQSEKQNPLDPLSEGYYIRQTIIQIILYWHQSKLMVHSRGKWLHKNPSMTYN